MSPGDIDIKGLNSMPHEIVLNIIRRLSKAELRRVVESNTWDHPITYEVLWRDTKVCQLASINNDLDFQTAAEFVEILWLSENRDPKPSEGLLRVLQHKEWPRLRRVVHAHAENNSYNIAFFKNLARAGKQTVTENKPETEQQHAIDTGVTDVEFVGWSGRHYDFAKGMREFTNLRSLEFKFTANRNPSAWPVGEGHFEVPPFAWKKLETAVVEWGIDPPPPSLHKTLSGSSKLKRLEIRVDTAEAVRYVGKMQSLTYLRLEIGSPAIISGPAQLEPISALSRLQYLELWQREHHVKQGEPPSNGHDTDIVKLVRRMRDLNTFRCSTLRWEIKNEEALKSNLQGEHLTLLADSIRLVDLDDE